MFCLKCGKSLPNDARFCDGCGTPIRQTDPFTAASGPGSPKPPQQPLGEAFTPPSHNAAPSSHPEENPSNSISSGSYPPCNSPSPQNSHSKKGLIVGLSIGGSVLLILLVVVILFVSGVFGSDTSPSVSDTSVSGSKTSEPSTESTEESKQNLSNSHPVLEITGIQLTYGEKMDSVEKKFPDMEKKQSDVIYQLADQALIGKEDQVLYGYIRTDPETNAQTLVGWMCSIPGSGVAGGPTVGDSYKKILEIYPHAQSAKEIQAQIHEEKAEPYDPDRDGKTSYTLFLDEIGNIYSHAEYSSKTLQERRDGTYDPTKWFMLDFWVEGNTITKISYGDERMLKMMQ